MARQRYRLQDTYPTTFPGAAYTAKRWLDAIEDATNPTYEYTITDEAIDIPASGDALLRVELDHMPNGNMSNTAVLRVNTLQSAAGTDFTGTTSTDELTTYQMRVYNDRPWIDFNRSALAAAGVTRVYATYKTITDIYTSTFANRVEKFMQEVSDWGVGLGAANGVNLVETTIPIGLLGGCLGDRFLTTYLDGGTVKWDYADASDKNKLPSGYLPTAAAQGDYPTVILIGKITTLALGPQPRKSIWASPVAGKYTWESDVSANVLTAGDYVCDLGRAISSTTAFINCINYPVYQKEP